MDDGDDLDLEADEGAGSNNEKRRSSKGGGPFGRGVEGAQEAAERRKIWAMAAASAAEMIKELTLKEPPKFDDVTKVFAPITPAAWAEKRSALEALRGTIDDMEEITDAQIAEELFYDMDANDEDLIGFLGPSDSHLKSRLRASFNAKGKKSMADFFGATKPQAAETIRRISTATDGAEDGETRRKSSNATNLSDDHEKSPSGQSSKMSIAEESSDATRKGSGPTTRAQSISASADDFFGDEDSEEGESATVPEEGGEEGEADLYFPAEVNINVDEALIGLESLLDDFKLESRITDRFKYKLINKYSLLLQALITYQEREVDTITHLQTKKKILNALHQFVKTEAELAAKAVVAEDEKDEDKEDGQGMDVMGANEEGDKGENKGNVGLSIEEMPAATIRETLLSQKNRLDVLESMKKVHVLQLKQLEFERTLLSLHYNKMVKPSDLSKEVKEGRRVVNELQLEISSTHQEMGQIQNEIRMQEKHVMEEEKSVEKLELEVLTKQGEVQILANKPIHVAKEADRESRILEQLQDNHDAICKKYMDMMESHSSCQAQVDRLLAELTALTKTEIKLQAQRKENLKSYDALMAQYDQLSSREHMLLERTTLIAERMQQLVKTKKKLMEEHHKITNDSHKFVREATRLDRTIKMAADSYLNARLAYDKMRSAFDAAKPGEQTQQWEKLSRMLQKEIFNLKNHLDRTLDEAKYRGEMVAKLQEKLNELYESHLVSGKELQDLIRATVRKRREREEKSAQCIKLEAQITRIFYEKKIREIAINECLRSEKIIFRLLTRIQKKFNQLKMEKSAVINELSVARALYQETKAKTEDLENKLNAYITQTQLFESMTKEKYFTLLNARIKRDSIKNDAMRSRNKFRFSRKQKLELLLNNKVLRREQERQKLESVKIRKEFEKSTSEADERAIKYRIRIEEVCTFHEYIYCYDKILLRGSEEIMMREIERQKLNALYEETRKHIFIVQANQPDEGDYFRRIEILREKFYKVTDTRRMLEVKLNEDDNPARVREIDFDKIKEKENVTVLEKKLDWQEECLAVRDVIGLEKELLENHLTSLAEDALQQALYLKDFFGEHVKAVTNIRRCLGNLSQQIEGFICENAIAAAQADLAEKHFNHCKKVLHEAEIRFANGEAPTDAIGEEWDRMQWRKEMIKKANDNYNRPGFYRQVVPWNGAKIQASKWTICDANRRKLEDPKDSVLGWRFSAVSDPIAEKFSNSYICRQSAASNKGSGYCARRSAGQIFGTNSYKPKPATPNKKVSPIKSGTKK